ncbi:MAG: helix-turn-helix domain-containing protein [Clostridiales bacterium]|nr:helix-turn-helix domain-containing protein [Clostridiales bacterium]
MADRHLQERMESILARLSIPVTVIDREYDAHTLQGTHLAEQLEDGLVIEQNGSKYFSVPKTHIVLSCSASDPGAENVLKLASELVATLSNVNDAYTENSYDVYRRALRGELTGSELEALSHEHQLPSELERCVLVFHIVQTDQERAYDLLKDITPLQDKDVLVDMDRHTVVLLKDVSEDDEMDDLTQFAQALQETLMGETAHQMTIGIGRSRRTIEELRESYMEARRAIEVGRTFKPEDSIYVYNRLILERFLMELPQDISAYYHSLLFNRKNQRLFNEEMLYTIDMFFKKDLNLSDTARQLYIHRNTLVYRLDKVQKQIGLDLRSFEDAVTFKILMELKKVSGERTPHKS